MATRTTTMIIENNSQLSNKNKLNKTLLYHQHKVRFFKKEYVSVVHV